MPLDAATAPEIRHSACPHDCPSTCALEVEVLSEGRIGRVRGAKAHPYTAGVICAKVARYAERVHHPERLTQPLRRIGDKGVGRPAFEEISWDAELDGAGEAPRVLDMTAGALVLFRGRTALHRVTPVEAGPPRLLAVLSYGPEPGNMLTEHTRKIFYGRVG